MKKYMRVLAIIGLFILCTGCGEKKLECEMTSKESGITMEQKVNATFGGAKLKEMDMKIDVLLDDKMKDYSDEMVKSFDKEFASYKDKKGVEFKLEEKEDRISISVKANLKEMDDEARKALDVDSDYDTYENAKKDLEKEGYTCK